MIEKIISFLAIWIIGVISYLGTWGIVICMAIESACIPLPSEIIMPFSGYLVSTGHFTLWEVSLSGAVGNVIGSLLAYYAGSFLGREAAYRYGRYVLISSHDLERAERWFGRFGSAAVFFSRLMPIVRTFISFPAGISRMPIIPFIIYTFAGSLPWCYGLAWIGMKMGEHWNTLGKYFHRFDAVIGILLVIGFVFWLRHHLKNHRKDPLAVENHL